MWIKCGDRNIKFFHATATNRCRKNRIEGLYDSDGIWREDQEEVEDIILKYFKEIYSTTYPVDFGVSLSAVDRRVLEAMNEDLLREFREEEVWQALKQMYSTKSLGPDCMSSIFYQRYWDVVGPQVVDYALQILRTGVMPNGLNDTHK